MRSCRESGSVGSRVLENTQCSRILSLLAPNETQQCAILTACSRRLSTFQVSKLLISDLRTFLVLWFLHSPVLHSRFSGTSKFLHVALRQSWESYDFLPKHSQVTIVSKSCASCLEIVVCEGRSLPRKSGNHCNSSGIPRGRFTHEGGECPGGEVPGRRSWRFGSLRSCRESGSVGSRVLENTQCSRILPLLDSTR